MNLSEIIKKNKDTILDNWLKRVKKEIPSAKGKDKNAILDSLPKLIDQLINYLASPKPEDFLKQMMIDLAVEHGKQRSEMMDYTVDQVVWEYEILTEVLSDVIEAEGDKSLTQHKRLLEFIFAVIRDAGSEFTKEKERMRILKHHQETQEAAVNFNEIIDGVAEYAIFTLSSEGIIETWNTGAHRMKQYTSEEAIGNHFEMLYPKIAQERNEPMEHLRAAKIEGRFRGEGLRVKKSGETFIADVFIIPIKKDGKVGGYCKIVQNLSERNHLIQERDLSRSELSNLKIEKDMRETFVETLTHDLRGPLAAAKVSAELTIRNPSDQDRNLRFMYKIVEHINRADKMISNLLDANKIRAGEKLILHLKECSMLKIVNEVAEETSTTYGTIIHIMGEDVLGKWDEEALRRILENLVTNAIKYGDTSRPIKIEISLNTDMVSLKVHNFGNPIELPDQNLLFQKFQRINSVKDRKGWGLGLTLVKGLVEAHHGAIKVESYPIEGTTFTIDLPLDSSHKSKEIGGSPS